MFTTWEKDGTDYRNVWKIHLGNAPDVVNKDYFNVEDLEDGKSPPVWVNSTFRFFSLAVRAADIDLVLSLNSLA